MSFKKIRPILDHVIIQDMEFGEQKTAHGIIILNDDGKQHGIKPRWGRVYAVGPKQEDVKVGDWVLVEHGRWTRGVNIEGDNGETITVRRVDTEAMIVVYDQKPGDVYVAAEL